MSNCTVHNPLDPNTFINFDEYFKTFASFEMCVRGKELVPFTIFNIIVYSILLIFTIWLIYKCRRKLRLIQEPIPGATHEETFCLISCDIYWFTQMLLGSICLRLLYQIFQYALWEEWQNVFLTEHFLNCDGEDDSIKTSVAEMLSTLFCKYLKYTLEHIVVLVQIQEWQSMLLLIEIQKGREDGEVLFAFNAEDDLD